VRSSSILICLAMLAGCGGDKDVPAAEFGKDLFSSPKVSTSRYNTFACATCHVVDPAAGVVVSGRLDSGYNLAGAPTRGSWWGGGETSLLDAMNVCITQFMGGRALTKDQDETKQLDAYLEANTAPTGMAAPFTVVRVVGSLDGVPGDANRGRAAYQSACFRCHGEANSMGKGRSSPIASPIPEATNASFPGLGRAVTVEKVRHGRFFNVGGLMPFYTAEAMSDQTLADILSFLGF
jgi:thiosulfate dehydrogenase